MKLHSPKLVGALLDGELKGLRRLLVQRHVRRCTLCAAEYRRQHHVREMLAANQPTAQMSDSPEFFWSEVKREIEARGAETADVPVPRLSPLDWFGQHRFALASAAAIFVAALTVVSALHSPKIEHLARVAVPSPIPIAVATAENVSTAIPDTVATAVDADGTDTLVIWVSGLPWTADMTEMKTVFANLDT